MNLFTLQIFYGKWKCQRVLWILMFTSMAIQSSGQMRNYQLIYSDNIQGGCTMFGNTLMQIVNNGSVNLAKMNGNMYNGNSVYGNDNENMQYIDIDSSIGQGSVTRNSSSADLLLPAGTNTIKLARLYWGGYIQNSEFDLQADTNRIVKIRKGTTGNYADVTALGIDEMHPSIGYTEYQAYADITAFVKKSGAGTYEIGNAPLSTGPVGGGNHGGWCIVVVYENELQDYSSIRLYEGFQQVFNNANPLSTSVTLTGLDVPSGALELRDAKMGVLTWEGDANLKKDYLKINGHLFSNIMNAADNPWNGTITKNGIHVSSKNPNYSNQMGIDIDEFEVGSGYDILPNANKVALEFGTEADQYFPGVFTFTIKMKDPEITLDNIVTDANNNHLGEVNEVLTYTLKVSNTGSGNANNIVISDTLPNTVTFVPGSLKVINAELITERLTDQAGDDAAEIIENGSLQTVRFRIGSAASETRGGFLAKGENYVVQFQVTVNKPSYNRPVPSIINIARLKATSDASIYFVDDASSVMNPEGGLLPVTLLYFRGETSSKNANAVDLEWKTSMETNCKSFVIEKSQNGILFTAIQTVKGNGTTSLQHLYSYNDILNQRDGQLIYYRLRQIDFDGKISFSDVISIKRNRQVSGLNVYPNPFKRRVEIKVNWPKDEKVRALIYNAESRLVFSNSIGILKGENLLKLEELDKLPAGSYLLQLTSPGYIVTQKIIKL
ncbi:MAG: T9SS type A sorting domain-containing protein [Ginsengibacter sp.]